MKQFEFNRLTVVFVLLLALFAFGTAFAQWQPDVRLTNNDSSSVTSWSNARSVAASGDTVHVVWYDHRDGNDEIYYKRSTDNGATWGFLDTCLTDDPSVSNYPSVAASGSGVIAVWIDSRDTTPSWPKVFYKRSVNNGQTWGADARLSDDSSSAGHPSVTFSGSVVQAVWADNRNGNPEIYTNRSNDGGGSWGPDTRLTVNSYTQDDPSAAVSGSYVHVVWRDQRVGLHDEIYYKRSTTSGTTWGNDTLLSIGDAYGSSSPSISVSGSVVHVAWFDAPRGGEFEEIYYKRSTDNGATWDPVTRLTYNIDRSWYPSISSYGSTVQVVWYDGGGSYDIYSKRSTDNGTTWSPDTRLTTECIENASCQSVSITATTAHMVFMRMVGSNREIYYKRRLDLGGFDGFLTEPSQGRHLVRDPARNVLHLVMKSENLDSVYYLRSTDSGNSWSTPLLLGYGKYPTVGLAMLPEDIYPPYYALCVAFRGNQSTANAAMIRWKWNDNFDDPGSGDITHWHTDSIITSVGEVGAPSLTTLGERVYVAYPASQPGPIIFCDDFWYNNASGFTRDTIDYWGNGSGERDQPSLTVDGGGIDVHAAWKRGSEVYYAPRSNGTWPRLRVDYTNDPSQQPFVECYGDSVFVAWSDGQPSPSDVWRASKRLTDLTWYQRINVSSSSNPSESPTQAWREFTTWSEGTSDEPPMMFDINYWRPSGLTDVVESNPAEWSYWTHSQMRYPNPGINTDLWSAWTESPNAGQPPYRVLFKHTIFPFFGPGLGGELSDYGNYYKVLAGQDSASPYCRKRDGVMRFADKAVDFARDSLVYELPYLDPVYDYFVRVASYREAGSDWVQGLSVNAGPARTVRFAPNLVDTAWVRIPPEAYEKDRKVSFSLKNVRGDYVTGLSLTLFQRDPKRGKGGPQAGEPVTQPVMREVFAVYPNPVKGQAQIEYSLKTPSSVRLGIYDVTGRLVREVVNGAQPAGVHKATWDGKNVNGHQAPSGIYFLKLNSPGVNKTARFVVIR